MTSLPHGLLYLDANRIYLYDPNRGVLSVDLVPTVVADLEVVDRQALKKFVGFIIDSNKLTPLRLTIIVAESLLFRKKISTGPSSEDEQKKFIASVPFEHVMWKMYEEQSQEQEVIATNGDLITAIREAFESRGWAVYIVVPTIFLGEATMTGRVPDAALSQSALKKLDSLKTHALTSVTETDTKEEGGISSKEEEKKPRSFLTYLLPVLGVLIIILIIVFVMQFGATSPDAAKNPPAGPKPKTVATPTIAQITSLAAIKILITENTPSSASAALKTKLQEEGVSNVTVVQNPGIRAPQASVSFSNSVAPALRTQITGVVTSVFPNASITAGGQTAYEVLITLPSQ